MSHQGIGRTVADLPILLLAGIAGFVAGAATGRPIGNRHVPDPAKPVDLRRYAGLWYEMARYNAGFESGCEAATAHYAERPNGTIDVVNTCRRGSPDGPERRISGRARVVPGSGGAKLRVSFFGPFFVGDYWVLDHADDYGWSIVGEPSGKYLWVLTRGATPGDAEKDALIARVATLGYDTEMLRMTRQPPSP